MYVCLEPGRPYRRSESAAHMADASASRITTMLAAAGGSCSRGCTTQDKLHWWGKGLGDDDCIALAERLREPGRPRLKNLLLGSNKVGDRCIHALVGAADVGALSSLHALGLSEPDHRRGLRSAGRRTPPGRLPQLSDLSSARTLWATAVPLPWPASSACPRGRRSSASGSATTLSAGRLRRLRPRGAALSRREINLGNNSDLCIRQAEAAAAVIEAGLGESMRVTPRGPAGAAAAAREAGRWARARDGSGTIGRGRSVGMVVLVVAEDISSPYLGLKTADDAALDIDVNRLNPKNPLSSTS